MCATTHRLLGLRSAPFPTYVAHWSTALPQDQTLARACRANEHTEEVGLHSLPTLMLSRVRSGESTPRDTTWNCRHLPQSVLQQNGSVLGCCSTPSSGDPRDGASRIQKHTAQVRESLGFPIGQRGRPSRVLNCSLAQSNLTLAAAGVDSEFFFNPE